ncbi:NAD(P)/FAD-dependent oxidoreductase [Streptomyces sp. c-19]|uniref:NAD(P)/FAD-dependent oxidoreductase n=1 Tax=Streptomyces sp. c-19 TaxID=2789275 RepID=UPI00397ECA98
MTEAEGARPDYDVVISAAGLAGCAAAILLARRGVRVALLERRSDPGAYKVLCTHSLTANAYPVLDELGLVPALEKAGRSAATPAGTPAGDGSSRGRRPGAPSCGTRTTSGAAPSTR